MVRQQFGHTQHMKHVSPPIVKPRHIFKCEVCNYCHKNATANGFSRWLQHGCNIRVLHQLMSKELLQQLSSHAIMTPDFFSDDICPQCNSFNRSEYVNMRHALKKKQLEFSFKGKRARLRASSWMRMLNSGWVELILAIKLFIVVGQALITSSITFLRQPLLWDALFSARRFGPR